MTPGNVHLLTDPTPGLTHVSVVCRATMPERGTWDVRAATCPACLASSRSPAHPSSAPSMTEKAWLQQVRTIAHGHGWRSYHTLQSKGSEAGWPDLVLLRGPTLVCAELKTDRGRLTPAQQRWLAGLQQVKQVHSYLWRPGDLDHVLAVLRGSV